MVSLTSKVAVLFAQSFVDQAVAEVVSDIERVGSGISQKIWQNKPDFDSKIPPVQKAIAEVKGKINSLDELKVAFKTINDRCTDCHETYRVKLK